VRPRGLETKDHLGKRTIVGAVVGLEEARDYAAAGCEVMVDPFDQEELTRWEQIERSQRDDGKAKW
jgi:hypothetical protein